MAHNYALVSYILSDSGDVIGNEAVRTFDSSVIIDDILAELAQDAAYELYADVVINLKNRGRNK